MAATNTHSSKAASAPAEASAAAQPPPGQADDDLNAVLGLEEHITAYLRALAKARTVEDKILPSGSQPKIARDRADEMRKAKDRLAPLTAQHRLSVGRAARIYLDSLPKRKRDWWAKRLRSDEIRYPPVHDFYLPKLWLTYDVAPDTPV